jgi:LysR family transcriptional regulator, transcriptional activator of nhaA
MERLNYHHLLYFCTVAHEGSVARASLRLGLKQPTVSAQIHALEAKLGRKLLERSGRGLKVTPAGETVLRYAESIFALGGELLSALDGYAEEAPKLAVGVSSSLPQALVATLLEAVFGLDPRPVLNIVEGTMETLATQLASRTLQFVLTDVPPGNGAGLHRQVLLESAVEVFAPEALARKLRKDFPARMAGVSVLMPSGRALRRDVESWLASRKLVVRKLAEMPHPEMFAGSSGAAIFAPSLLRESLKRSQGLLPVGELTGLCWRMFVVTARKAAKHPGLDAVTRAAKVLR